MHIRGSPWGGLRFCWTCFAVLLFPLLKPASPLSCPQGWIPIIPYVPNSIRRPQPTTPGLEPQHCLHSPQSELSVYCLPRQNDTQKEICKSFNSLILAIYFYLCLYRAFVRTVKHKQHCAVFGLNSGRRKKKTLRSWLISAQYQAPKHSILHFEYPEIYVFVILHSITKPPTHMILSPLLILYYSLLKVWAKCRLTNFKASIHFKWLITHSTSFLKHL